MTHGWISGMAMALAAMSTPAVEATRVPDSQVNGIEWFYVFGRQGNTGYGAAAGQAKQVFHVEVPAEPGGPVTIRVLDADLQGQNDELDGALNTSTQFNVFGGLDLLSSRTVTQDEADGTVLDFGPYALAQGEAEGDQVVFRVEVEGLGGNDGNLFALEILPSQAQVFTHNPAIRLMAREGDQMQFFPQIPPGVTGVRVWNYDVDPAGGNSVLLTPPGPAGTARGIQRSFWIENSASAAWARTDVNIPEEWKGGGRWIYRITKKTQAAANMSLRVEDRSSKPLRIYFTPAWPGR